MFTIPQPAVASTAPATPARGADRATPNCLEPGRIIRRPIALTRLIHALLAAVAGIAATQAPAADTETGGNRATIVSVRKIWDQAPHNAFTGLTRLNDRWFCVFREGKGHVSPDGAIRVLASKDGDAWESAALLTSPRADLRDPKIASTPDGRLMIVGAGAMHPPSDAKHRSMIWFSRDKAGRDWSEPQTVADANLWLWRVTWHKNRAYGVGYDTTGEKFVRLYRSTDATATKFETVVPTLFDQEYPNETALVFLPDDRALCLLRRDGKPGHGLLGISKPPYTHWDWKDVGMKIGGPEMVRLPDGRLIAGVRLYDGKVRTAVVSIDAETGAARELIGLPSSGDSSYPGLVWHDGLLWVSYYSSHEGKTSIYLARVKLP